MTSQYSINVFLYSYVNMTLFYIECVLLDATFTMPLEFAPVVKG